MDKQIKKQIKGDIFIYYINYALVIGGIIM